MEIIIDICIESWKVFAQMAPYLLFGFLIAGMLSVYISSEWVERHLGGRGISPVLKASIFGIPLPLCSCGVIPVAASFNRHGASKSATTSFLLSTPQTGVDSILVTWSLLGPLFAVFRPIVALLTGVLGGGAVKWMVKEKAGSDNPVLNPDDCTDECCIPKKSSSKFMRVMKYGFHSLPEDIGPALLMGVFIAGLISAFVPPDVLTPYIGGGLISILILVAAGIPVYVCATASVPIAVAFIHLGASPGAALAFLIAGPATNAASFTTIAKVMGKKTTIIYLAAAGISAIASGLILNWLVSAFNLSILPMTDHSHAHEGISLLSQTSAIVLIFILIFAIVTKKFNIMSGLFSEKNQETGLSNNEIKFKIEGMNCNHCVMAVQKALEENSNVQSAAVDLSAGIAVVRGNNLNGEALISVVEKSGYQATMID